MINPINRGLFQKIRFNNKIDESCSFNRIEIENGCMTDNSQYDYIYVKAFIPIKVKFFQQIHSANEKYSMTEYCNNMSWQIKIERGNKA
jgi:hypothetical protein